MQTLIRSTLVMLLALILVSGCTKGSTLGGEEGRPEAIETAGAPPVPEHAPEDADSHKAAGEETHPAGEQKAPAH